MILFSNVRSYTIVASSSSFCGQTIHSNATTPVEKRLCFWVKYPTKIAYQTFFKCQGFAVIFVHSPVHFLKCEGFAVNAFGVRRKSAILLMNNLCGIKDMPVP